MKVIGLIGTIGAGKNVASNFLSQKGYQVVNMGDLVREIASRQDLKPTRKNLQKLAQSYRKRYGPGFFAHLTVERIKSNEWKKVLINGMRVPEDVTIPLEEFEDDLLILLIDAKPQIRFERLKERGRPGDPKTWKQFKKQEEKEQQLFKFRTTSNLADGTIANNAGKEEFKLKLKNLLKRKNYL